MRAKYIVPILAVIVLALLAGVAFAASPSLTVNDASGSPGSTVEVPINVFDASNIGSMDIVLTYDSSVLSVSSVEKGELTTTSMLASNTEMPGIIAIGIASSEGINGGGSVAIIAFNVSGGVGDTSPLTLESVEANDATTFIDIPITKTSGTFMVTEEVEEGLPLIPIVIGIVVVVVILTAAFVAVRRKKGKAIS